MHSIIATYFSLHIEKVDNLLICDTNHKQELLTCTKILPSGFFTN